MAAHRLALIDGDEVAFKACMAAQSDNEIDWGDGEVNVSNGVMRAEKAAVEMVKAWAEKVGAQEITVCLSCRDRNIFRKHVDPSYKSGRTEKPEGFWQVVDVLASTFDSVEHPSLEADDVLGIMSARTSDVQPIICSSDKDMRTIPDSLVFDPYHSTKKKITATMADNWWMTQTLIGDSTDGYKGCPKVGPKGAAKALDHLQHLPLMWGAVVDLFVEKGLSAKHALTQARLARILRPGDVDLKKKLIRLWHPSKPEWIPMEP